MWKFQKSLPWAMDGEKWVLMDKNARPEFYKIII